MKILPADVSQYGHGLPNLDPPVIIRQWAYQPGFCEKVTAAMLSSQTAKSGVYNDEKAEKVDDYHRSSSYCMLPQQLYQDVADVVTAAVNEAISKQVGSLVLAESLSFLKYDEVNGGKFLPHTDNAYFDGNGKFLYTSPHRVFTAISYMNEGYEGGLIILNSVLGDDAKPLMIQPTTGLLLIFPSDVRFKHEVTPVTKGVRCNIVSWFGYDGIYQTGHSDLNNRK